jgi:uncharacterized membrane protein YobD (UPF0266 family)
MSFKILFIFLLFIFIDESFFSFNNLKRFTEIDQSSSRKRFRLNSLEFTIIVSAILFADKFLTDSRSSLLSTCSCLIISADSRSIKVEKVIIKQIKNNRLTVTRRKSLERSRQSVRTLTFNRHVTRRYRR